MQFVIADFEAVATDYASRLRLESATRTQAAVYRGLQDRIRALQTVARLFDLEQWPGGGVSGALESQKVWLHRHVVS